MSDKEEFQRFSVSLPKELFDEFEKFRTRNNASRSDAIRKAMRDYIVKETREEQLLSQDFVTAVIVLNLEHAWEGHEHDHQHISTEEHTKEHKHDHITQIMESNYFSYPDTDMIKINHLEHIYHDIVVTKLHIHSAHDKCILLLPVKGPGERIKTFYKNLMQLKSVLSHTLILED